MNATVKDVMTVDVIAVAKDTPFEEIAAALRRHRVSAFPVIDEESRVIGVVSESDLLAKLALGIGDDDMRASTEIPPWRELEKAHAITATDLMSSPVVTVSPEDTAGQAASLMYKRNVKRLPVTDPDGHLAGIVSRADVLAVYSRADAEIAQQIGEGIFTGEQHMAGRPFAVSVRAGVATIFGQPLTAGQGYQIVRAARHVEGVVAVRDRLDYPLPARVGGPSHQPPRR